MTKLFPRVPLAAVVAAAACALVLAAPAGAEVVELADNNSTAYINTDHEEGMVPDDYGMIAWEVDGINHMYQQWFWYRVGLTGGESSISTLDRTYQAALNMNPNPGNDALLLHYTHDTGFRF